MVSIKRKPARVAYYARNIALDICPPVIFRRRLEKILHSAGDYDQGELAERINYCNKLKGCVDLTEDARSVGNISLASSMYYYDLKEHARYFPRKFRLNYLFGDVRTVAEQPSFTKSRPIRPDNANNVLMNLDKLRHFYIPRDEIAFKDKKSVAVWRGGSHNPTRRELIRLYRDHPLCDVGFSNVDPGHSDHGSFLHPLQQMTFKYIISIEGNDVATNLKWIMASNSLCLMPAPVFETWFMEGRLQAGTHYVRLAPDLNDLEDKLLYYERHPDEARAIIRNANDYVDRFLDAGREQVLSILVMYKYFVATGQVEPDEAVARLFEL